MDEQQFDGSILLVAGAVALFPIAVVVGVKVLRSIIIRRNPDLEA
ncbi:hypothetical protein [Agrococcus beijingensis]|nr:hypothetical protein [Agrococcus sp. REN33]